MNFSLRVRIILAVVSGLACALVYFLPKNVEIAVDPKIGEATGYGLIGLLFAAGVLFPYVGPGKLRYVRYLGLFLASVVGYWCASWLALHGPGSADNPFPGGGDWPTPLSVTVGSVAGASIVMLALVLIAPIRSSFAYVLLGVLAAVGGGLLSVVSIEITANLFREVFLSLGAAHAVWHTLVCLAIYFGTPSTSAGARFSGGLVGLFKRQA